MWLRDLSCLTGAVYCLILKHCMYINSPLSPVIAEENAQQPRLFLRTFLSTKIYSRRGEFNAYLQILLLDFSP